MFTKHYTKKMLHSNPYEFASGPDGLVKQHSAQYFTKYENKKCPNSSLGIFCFSFFLH